MTELTAAIDLLMRCSFQFDVIDDCLKLDRIRSYTASIKDENHEVLDSTLVALSSLYKALVNGLNSRKFKFTSSVFRSKKLTAYPRLFSGLMTTIFYEDGCLRDDWSRDAAELLLQTLAFFKRVNVKALRKKADQQAKTEFVEYQQKVRPFSLEVGTKLRKFWNEFSRDIERYATLGYAGTGASLDKVFPHANLHSYLNTWDPTLPTSIRDFYDEAFRKETDFADSRSWSVGSEDEQMPGLYPLVHKPILKTVCVPKNTQTSRLITITHVGNAITGATYRETLVSLWKARGVDHQLNIFDQSLSHKTLVNNFDTVSLFDLEGGSSCLTNNLNEVILPDFFRDFLDTQKGSKFKVENFGYFGWDWTYPVTTQLMGDSISVGLLTTTLYMCVALAYFDHLYGDEYKRLADLQSRCADTLGVSFVQSCITRERITHIFDLMKDQPINIVGDDVVIPSFLEDTFRKVLIDLGISINEKKSSSQDANHKETCGCWALKEKDGTVRRIYPWRFPSGDTKPERLQAATGFLNKAAKSTYIHELTCSLASLYGNELRRSSFNQSDIGSPVGSGMHFCVSTTNTVERARISDESFYRFNVKCISAEPFTGPSRNHSVTSFGASPDPSSNRFGDHSVVIQRSERSEVTKLRFRPYRDKSRPISFDPAKHKSHWERATRLRNQERVLVESLSHLHRWVIIIVSRYYNGTRVVRYQKSVVNLLTKLFLNNACEQ